MPCRATERTRGEFKKPVGLPGTRGIEAIWEHHCEYLPVQPDWAKHFYLGANAHRGKCREGNVIPKRFLAQAIDRQGVSKNPVGWSVPGVADDNLLNRERRRRTNCFPDPMLLLRRHPNITERWSSDDELLDQPEQVSHDTNVWSTKTADYPLDFDSPGGSPMWRVNIQIGENQWALIAVMHEALVQRAQLVRPLGWLECAGLQSLRCKREFGEYQEYFSRKSCSNSVSFSGQG